MSIYFKSTPKKLLKAIFFFLSTIESQCVAQAGDVPASVSYVLGLQVDTATPRSEESYLILSDNKTMKVPKAGKPCPEPEKSGLANKGRLQQEEGLSFHRHWH